MSDKLAISAAFSIFMMTAYVLFGGEASRAPIGPGSLEAPVAISMPALPSIQVQALVR